MGRALEEKRRLTEELLRERRQMEARQLAEQRSRERETELLQTASKSDEMPTEFPEAEKVQESRTEEAEVKVSEFVPAKEERVAEEQPVLQEEAAAALDPFEQQLQLMLAEFLA